MLSRHVSRVKPWTPPLVAFGFVAAFLRVWLGLWSCETAVVRDADPADVAGRLLAAARATPASARAATSLPTLRAVPKAVCAHVSPPWPARNVPRALLERPLVSVVTTCHDADSALLRETARCVLAQTVPSWEWIVVDDFSAADGALRELRELDPRIRLVRSADFVQDSRGNLGRARNVGAGVARGDFLAFIDADDLLDPMALELWIYYLAAHPGAHFVNGFTRGFGAFEYDWARGFNPSHAFRGENQVAVTSMHRRASFMAVGGFPVRDGGLEDWELWFRYAAAGLWGGTVPEFLFWYRRRPSHADRWDDFGASGAVRFHARMRELFPALEAGDGEWPAPPFVDASPLELDVTSIPDLGLWPPESWPLMADGAAWCGGRGTLRQGATAPPAAAGPRLLLLLNRLGDPRQDLVALSLADAVMLQGWHVSVVVTVRGVEEVERMYKAISPDLMVLDALAPPTAFPSIVSAAISLRQPRVVVGADGLAGAILPLLKRAHGGHVAFLNLLEAPPSPPAKGSTARGVTVPAALAPDAAFRQALYAQLGGNDVVHHV